MPRPQLTPWTIFDYIITIIIAGLFTGAIVTFVIVVLQSMEVL